MKLKIRLVRMFLEILPKHRRSVGFHTIPSIPVVRTTGKLHVGSLLSELVRKIALASAESIHPEIQVASHASLDQSHSYLESASTIFSNIQPPFTLNVIISQSISIFNKKRNRTVK